MVRSQQVMLPRDCTDIAVKLGFELGERQRTCNSIEQIKNLAIEQISNQNILNLKGLNTRPLQSSDYTQRESSKKIVDKFLTFSEVKNFFDINKSCLIGDIEIANTLLEEFQNIN